MPKTVPGPEPIEPPRGLLVAGHINVDRFLQLPEFPAPDRTVPIRSSRSALGGPAANLARGSAAVGIPTGLIGRIGDDFPDAFLRELGRAGLDLRGVERVPGTGTPTCYILENDRRETEVLIDQGPMGSSAPPSIPRGLLTEYRWLHLTTGHPRWQLAWKAAARAAGLRVAVDPAQEVHYRWTAPQLRHLLEGAEILFGNRSEIDRIKTLLGARRVEELLTRVPLVIRTEGARGATAFARTGRITVPGIRVARPVTTVGAGDAFRAGFYFGWWAGAPLRDCLRAGHRSAARWVRGGRVRAATGRDGP
ncbi:MAG: PfkB family carbohydrate kinase [Thermoplasmata archaeon]|jgi:sugar/nucleoside kinase (ribokinase family)